MRTGFVGYVGADAVCARADRAGRIQALGDGGGGGRSVIPEDLAPAGGHTASAIEHVLVRERHAVQGAELRAGLDCAIGCACGLQRVVFFQSDEAVDARLHGTRPRDARTSHFQR